MQVDFYQLAGSAPEQVIASLADKILSADGRLLIVAGDDAYLARLDRMLWDQGPASFLPHGIAGGRTTRASRSCFRPAPTPRTSRATC